jgi:hypothetical protein
VRPRSTPRYATAFCRTLMSTLTLMGLPALAQVAGVGPRHPRLLWHSADGDRSTYQPGLLVHTLSPSLIRSGHQFPPASRGPALTLVHLLQVDSAERLHRHYPHRDRQSGVDSHYVPQWQRALWSDSDGAWESRKPRESVRPVLLLTHPRGDRAHTDRSRAIPPRTGTSSATP